MNLSNTNDGSMAQKAVERNSNTDCHQYPLREIATSMATLCCRYESACGVRHL
jgi:hypothetical protein